MTTYTKKIKRFKSINGMVFDTAKEAREEDREVLCKRRQKICKHLKTRTQLESRSDCLGYEMYDRYTVYAKSCLICGLDDLEVTEKDQRQCDARIRRNEYQRERNRWAKKLSKRR